MKKLLTQLTDVFLLLAVLFGLAFTVAETAQLAAAASDDDTVTDAREQRANQIVRVGLRYGSDAMDGATLKNSANSTGFYFGYYNSDNEFVQLGSTDKTNISVVKTQNVYYGTYGGYTSYHDNLTAAAVGVGCYHLQLPGAYSSYDAALSVAARYSKGFVAYIGGVYYVRIGSYLSSSAANNAQADLAASGVSATVKGTSSYGISVVATGTNTMLFQYDDQGSGTGLGVIPIPSAADARQETEFRSTDYYGGFRIERISGGNLTVVNMIALDDYTEGVVSREMSSYYPLEALKAQAVAARTFTLYNENRHKSYHFDVCYTTHCHAYSGNSRVTEKIQQAVSETHGAIATYNGRPIQAVYYACNGGASEDTSLVWGSVQSSYPYLEGVIDPYEETVADNFSMYYWTETFTAAQLTNYVRNKGYNCGTIVTFQISSYSDTGNPATVTFIDSSGRKYTFNSRRFVVDFGLQSYNYGFGDTDEWDLSINGDTPVEDLDGAYVIDGDGNVSKVSNNAYVITGYGTNRVGEDRISGSSFTLMGKGWGHNVGLSQYGAYAMGQLGFTYDEILKFYYTGIEVE